MNEDNVNESEEVTESEETPDATSRARNKTVMLTPEVTGQLRALLNREEGGQQSTSTGDPLSDLLPPVSWEGEEESAQAEPAAAPPVEESTPPLFGAETRSPSGSFSRPEPTGAVTQSFGSRSGSSTSLASARPAFTVNSPQTDARQKLPKSKIVGFLVSFDENKLGEVFEIRAGRWLLTSAPTEHGDYILIRDETISSLHAIIRATKDGKVQVLDQLSEHGTGLFSAGTEEEQEVAGSLVTLGHGDLIRFGKRFFTVCMIPEVEYPETYEDAEQE